MCLLQLQLADLFAGAVAADTNDGLVALDRNISAPLTGPEMQGHHIPYVS